MQRSPDPIDKEGLRRFVVDGYLKILLQTQPQNRSTIKEHVDTLVGILRNWWQENNREFERLTAIDTLAKTHGQQSIILQAMHKVLRDFEAKSPTSYRKELERQHDRLWFLWISDDTLLSKYLDQLPEDLKGPNKLLPTEFEDVVIWATEDIIVE